MSDGILFVQTDGLRTFSQSHADIAAGLSQLIGAAAPAAAGVVASHGTIAAAVSSALGNVLDARGGTIQTTTDSGNTIAELLHRAAQMYEQGDQQSAEKIRAAAEALERRQGGQAAGSSSGTGGPGGSGSPASPSSAGAGGDMMGQIAGQLGQVGSMVGQMIGQTAQAVTGSLQGLAQPLQQLPQQVMQAAQQAGSGAENADGDLKEAGDAQDSEKDERTAAGHDSRGADAGPEGRDPHEPRAQAAAGESANTGRVPGEPPAERAEPAQTRPHGNPYV